MLNGSHPCGVQFGSSSNNSSGNSAHDGEEAEQIEEAEEAEQVAVLARFEGLLRGFPELQAAVTRCEASFSKTTDMFEHG